jgi:hypothetical protein
LSFQAVGRTPRSVGDYVPCHGGVRARSEDMRAAPRGLSPLPASSTV